MDSEQQRSAHECVKLLRFPDFLGVGIQKCGTSWLDRNLRLHPDLWLPAIKELHYFNTIYLREKGPHWSKRLRKSFVTDSLKWQFAKVSPEKWNLQRLGELAHLAKDAVDDEWYGTVFASADPHQICGEITPDYALLPERAMRHIVALSQSIKLIVALRDPIERSWSEIRMVASERGLTSEDDLHAIARQFDVFHRTDYVGILKKWSGHVPADRIHVLFLDEILADPKSVITKVCEFLDVRPDPSLFPDLHRPANVGQAMEIPDSLHALLKEQLRGRYLELAEVYPDVVKTWSEKHQL